jgi:hypothetical protein
MEAPPLHATGKQAQLPSRRIWLKSAAATLASAYALPSIVTAASNQNSGRPEKAIESKMVGFMLAHEQVTVPQVIDVGVAAEHAGFDLLATSDHFQPWQANEGHSGEAWVRWALCPNARSESGWERPLPVLRSDITPDVFGLLVIGQQLIYQCLVDCHRLPFSSSDGR